MNRTSLFKILPMVTALAAMASVAFGGTIQLYTNSYSDVARGGEFTAITNPALDISGYAASTKLTVGTGALGFETFCLEYNQEFYPANNYPASQSTYNYIMGNGVVSNVALNGDSNAGYDTISVGTAWLYSQFAQGTLPDYYYGSSDTGGVYSSRRTAALYLQLAFWVLEDETGQFQTAYPSGVTVSGNPFLNMVVNGTGGFGGFGSLAGAKADAADGQDGVSVINPYYGSNPYSVCNQAQSQLYYHSVPDNGATLVLLGIALLGLAGFKRRTRRGG